MFPEFQVVVKFHSGEEMRAYRPKLAEAEGYIIGETGSDWLNMYPTEGVENGDGNSVKYAPYEMLESMFKNTLQKVRAPNHHRLRWSWSSLVSLKG